MDSPIVKVKEGRLKGYTSKNINGETIYNFLGVPYGKAPVGELRFKAPQPVEPWDGVKDATQNGDPCYNRDMAHETDNKIRGGEDCLVLNVFTKDIIPDKPKPVMAYIHGGGFTMGSNDSSIYGPEYLLTQDVVIVVMNYRLGFFGCLSLEDESLGIHGNAGLKDQVLALKWIQSNIQAFGGDPKNVTIFGESAGSKSVHLHILSQASSGLFHKAILQSGVALCSWALGSSNTPVIADALGIPGANDKEVLEMLNSMPGPDLVILQEKMRSLFGHTKNPKRPYAPVIEKPNPEAFLTKNPLDIIKSGEYNHVPIFIGYTSNEGILLEVSRKYNMLANTKTQYKYLDNIPWRLEVSTEKANEVEDMLSSYYSQFKEPKNQQLLMMDTQFLFPIVGTIVNHLKTTKCPIYVYRVSAENKRNFVKQIHNLTKFEGTSHADELGYLWNIYSLPKIEPNTIEHVTMERFVKLWTNFATTSNPTPNADLEVVLPPVRDGSKIPVLDIGEKITVVEDIPEKERIELWKKIDSLNSYSEYL